MITGNKSDLKDILTYFIFKLLYIPKKAIGYHKETNWKPVTNKS